MDHERQGGQVEDEVAAATLSYEDDEQRLLVDPGAISNPKSRLNPFVKQRWEQWMLEFSHILPFDNNNNNNDHAVTIRNQFYKMYRNGVPYRILSALVHLAGNNYRTKTDISVRASEQNDFYEDRITMLASYLLSFMIPKRNKLECLRAMFMVLYRTHTNERMGVLSETVTDETLQFLTEPPGTTTNEWQLNWKDAEMEVLFWELRAVCRRQWELLAQRRRDCLARLARSGEAAADYITNTASRMERALLTQSLPMIHNGIDHAGNFLKKFLTPAEHDALMAMSRDDTMNNNIDHHLTHGKPAVVLLIYTDAAKRATGNAKDSVRIVLHGIRDGSTEGIHWVVHRMDEEKVGERLITDPSSRDVLAAWGKVGLASLGATAILSEAMLEATKSIGHKLATVTAHVVEHKYGALAGQVVQDSCDATGNVLRTVTYVMMFKTKVITKVIVRNTAKVQCRKQMSEGEERRISASLNPASLLAMADDDVRGEQSSCTT